jgi:hypothetical protein
MAQFPDWRPSAQNSERHSISLLNERLSFAASTDDHAQTDRQTEADMNEAAAAADAFACG